MKSRYVLVLLAVSFLAVGCIGGGTKTTKTDEQLAISQVEKLIAGLRLKDADIMGEVAAPEIKLTEDGEQPDHFPDGREEFVQTFDEMFDGEGGFAPFTHGPITAVTVGSNIVIHVDVQFPHSRFEYLWTFELIKSSGKWLVAQWDMTITKNPNE